MEDWKKRPSNPSATRGIGDPGPGYIRSRQNSLIKFLRSLHLKKRRQESGLCLCEGARVVTELLRSEWAVEHLLLSPRAAHLEPLTQQAKDRGALVSRISDSLADYLADAEQSQGIFAVARWSPAHRQLSEPPRAPVVILDGIADPGNVGSIIRTAAGFGGQTVVLLGDCADPFNPKTIRATAGSIFHLLVVQAREAEAILPTLSAHRIRLCVAAARGGKPPWEVDLTGAVAIALGHETHGVSENLQDPAAQVITIPLSDATESLNVGAAASAILYEMARQNVER